MPSSWDELEDDSAGWWKKELVIAYTICREHEEMELFNAQLNQRV